MQMADDDNDVEIDGDDDGDDDDEDGLPMLPPIPFLVPSTSESERLKLGDEGGSTIYRAIRQNVLDVFGDEGWGRVSSSFKGMSASHRSYNSAESPTPSSARSANDLYHAFPSLHSA